MRRELAMLAIAMTLPAILRPPKPALAATAEMAHPAPMVELAGAPGVFIKLCTGAAAR